MEYHEFNEALGKDIPGDFLSTRSDGLTAIKPYYVIDQLNEIFGAVGWSVELLDSFKVNDELICLVRLTIHGGDSAKEAYGSIEIGNRSVGDAYKSAMTNAICKAASFLGIGIEVYLGNVTLEGHHHSATEATRGRSASEEDDAPSPSKYVEEIVDLYDKAYSNLLEIRPGSLFRDDDARKRWMKSKFSPVRPSRLKNFNRKELEDALQDACYAVSFTDKLLKLCDKARKKLKQSWGIWIDARAKDSGRRSITDLDLSLEELEDIIEKLDNFEPEEYEPDDDLPF